MLYDLLVLAGFLAVFLLLSPCSPFSVWKGGACAWKPKPKPAVADRGRKGAP